METHVVGLDAIASWTAEEWKPSCLLLYFLAYLQIYYCKPPIFHDLFSFLNFTPFPFTSHAFVKYSSPWCTFPSKHYACPACTLRNPADRAGSWLDAFSLWPLATLPRAYRDSHTSYKDWKASSASSNPNIHMCLLARGDQAPRLFTLSCRSKQLPGLPQCKGLRCKRWLWFAAQGVDVKLTFLQVTASPTTQQPSTMPSAAVADAGPAHASHRRHLRLSYTFRLERISSVPQSLITTKHN